MAIQGANGKYLSMCTGCWPRAKWWNSAHIDHDTPDQLVSQWKAAKQENGKWTFQADYGEYLARCYDCAPSNHLNIAFINTPYSFEKEAQWTLG